MIKIGEFEYEASSENLKNVSGYVIYRVVFGFGLFVYHGVDLDRSIDLF